MATPESFQGRLKAPAIVAPMFLTSGLELEVESRLNGVEDAFPGLNQRPSEDFVEWLEEIDAHPEGKDAAPCSLNLIVLSSKHHLQEALEIMRGVLHIASSEVYVRRIEDEGQAVGTLALLLSQSLKENNEHTEPLRIDHIQSLLDTFGPEIQEQAASPKPQSTLLDPLTRKETRVVQLLSEGYSNSTMAEKLCVSDSTVRTHLRNINSKLNASNRTQAVAIARRLGIV
ncbi:helix-turn-helix transcriptional regulator [Marinobacter sp. AN1]|uniref:helix-turn-helix transcriptional regulator n=1 Tax=Marinobacter sp. AN1 TaxID=2886046 RepID=UPI00222E2AFB|nr:LuxR C-terminal-related transcriptional regulator [Marinobacter sp. AN1]UZD64680.1 LuxR C-terminal-related transcriptional regulator [Marinobacter sp. AN1]